MGSFDRGIKNKLCIETGAHNERYAPDRQVHVVLGVLVQIKHAQLTCFYFS